MTPDAEQRVREAAQRFADELIAAVAASAPAGPERLLSVDEAAQLLGIGRSKLYQLLAAGRLRSLSIGDRRLIPASSIDAYIAGSRSPGAAA
jgi:excisionase family DNA binding protein